MQQGDVQHNQSCTRVKFLTGEYMLPAHALMGDSHTIQPKLCVMLDSLQCSPNSLICCLDMQQEEVQPAGQASVDAVPSVFPPTFSGGSGLRSGTGHLPLPEPYREPHSIGPLAQKRRSQSLIKNDRSGEVLLRMCSQL